MTTAPLKTCTSCGETTGVDNFYAHAKSSDGLQSQCKPCMKLASKKQYRTNRLEILRVARVKYRMEKWKGLK